MAFEVKMPQLGLTMEEGTVTKWLKQEGDQVSSGDVLLEITTDKLTSEVESEHNGILLKIIAKEGEDIPVKGLLAYIGEAGETIEGADVNTTVESVSIEEDKKEVVLDKTDESKETKRIKISPLAKKTAAKLGVDYTNLNGSGPGGRIIQRDILTAPKDADNKDNNTDFIAKSEVKPAEKCVTNTDLMDGDEVVALTGMRRVVAERMLISTQEIPTVTQNVKVDVTNLMLLRKKINNELNVKYSLNDYVLKATAKALNANKHILVSLIDDKIIKRNHVNIGMAVALDDGLIVPVIKDADKMSLGEISEKAKDLAARARTNKLSLDEYKGSTFSISNLGMFGVETFNPIINQPDAGILGVCAVNDELVMDDEGKIEKRQFMRLSFTYDHRLIDGATAAKFELAIKDLLEEPMRILL